MVSVIQILIPRLDQVVQVYPDGAVPIPTSMDVNMRFGFSGFLVDVSSIVVLLGFAPGPAPVLGAAFDFEADYLVPYLVFGFV